MELVYHGTDKESGQKILRGQHMKYSRGDSHWLGDGIYFYKDRLCVYRWIWMRYQKQYPEDKESRNIYKYYMILRAELIYDSDRLFSFAYPEHKIEFDYVKEKMNHTIRAGVCKKLQSSDITDGVVLNIMFRKLGYEKDYDVVEGIFPLTESGDAKSRFAGLLEKQYCVKNPAVVKTICDCTEEFDCAAYHKKLNGYYNYRRANAKKYKG